MKSACAAVAAISAALAAAEPAPVEVGGVAEHRSTWGLFLGDTRGDRRHGLTLGLEYEYRPDDRFGVGFTAEHVGGDFGNGVAVVPFAMHTGPWKVYAGPGLEHSDEGVGGLLRIGAEYGFRFRRLEVSPQLDVDFSDGERLFVIGVVLAWER